MLVLSLVVVEGSGMGIPVISGQVFSQRWECVIEEQSWSSRDIRHLLYAVAIYTRAAADEQDACAEVVEGMHAKAEIFDGFDNTVVALAGGIGETVAPCIVDVDQVVFYSFYSATDNV